ncbi:hypothetical protein [Corynebacterium tapiri]|uniref:Uncharacterized protein n=1 Tax=Corynebacterium tapiri TaxID=1448266 RepID=A0A5C4U1K1_9CORY|nr:hypothetical protein [Corynebacterium tapiri]TNL95080.1 hypothetical protein FHE74_09860 [Corynebacterium tapiri]
MTNFRSRVTVDVQSSEHNHSASDVLSSLIDGHPISLNSNNGANPGGSTEVTIKAADAAEADKVLCDALRLRRIPGTDYAVKWSLPVGEDGKVF